MLLLSLILCSETLAMDAKQSNTLRMDSMG